MDLGLRRSAGAASSDPWGAAAGVASGGLAEDQDLGRITVAIDYLLKAEVLSPRVLTPRDGRGGSVCVGGVCEGGLEGWNSPVSHFLNS